MSGLRLGFHKIQTKGRSNHRIEGKHKLRIFMKAFFYLLAHAQRFLKFFLLFFLIFFLLENHMQMFVKYICFLLNKMCSKRNRNSSVIQNSKHLLKKCNKLTGKTEIKCKIGKNINFNTQNTLNRSSMHRRIKRRKHCN